MFCECVNFGRNGFIKLALERRPKTRVHEDQEPGEGWGQFIKAESPFLAILTTVQQRKGYVLKANVVVTY
jgi:hypothetical protein